MKARFFVLACVFIMCVGFSSAVVVLSDPNCGYDQCTPSSPCSNGFGDCDGNSDCTTGLCVYDVGLQYGCPRWVDICVSGGPTSSSSSTSSSSTTTALSTTSTIVPYLPNCDISRCLPSSPCDNGFGDCDSDSGCFNGSCTYDVGLQYGCPRWVDICVFNSLASFTSSSSSSSSLASSSSSSSSLPNVYGCRILSVPDREYRQMADIQPNIDRGGGCIVVNGSNITLDCLGYTMVNDSFTSAGVYSNQLGTTIKNCNISLAGNLSSLVIGSLAGVGLPSTDGISVQDSINAFNPEPGGGSLGTGCGIYLKGANNSRIYGSTLKYQAVGIYLGSTYYAVIENNSLFNNSLGIVLVGSSYNNLSRTVVSTLINGSLIEWNESLLGFSPTGHPKATGGGRSTGELGNSIKSMFLKDNPGRIEHKGEGDTSDLKEETSTPNSFVDVDALMDEMPDDYQIKDVGTLSLIGITIINQSSHNMLSSVTVNNSLFGIIIGRNSDYNTLSNTKVNIALLGITIGNSSYSRLSGVTTVGNLLGILIVRNSSNTNLSGVISSIGLLGITLGAGSGNSFNNVIASYNLLGIGLYANNYNNITNIRAYNNTLAGIGFYDSTGNLIKNANLSENGYYDFILGASSNRYCIHTLDNVSSSDGRMIAYYNSTVLMSNNVLSELILCGADYSVLDNITIAGSDALGNNGLMLIRTNMSNITNINSSGNYYGLYLVSSSRDFISNLTVNNNSEDGVYLDVAGYNTITGVTAKYNEYDGFYMDEGAGNVISDFTTDYNEEDGFDSDDSVNNTISRISSSYNQDDGFEMVWGFNNTVSNVTSSFNEFDGVYLYYSIDNVLSNFTSKNNLYDGFYVYAGMRNTFSSISANNNSINGFELFESSINNISNANISDSGNVGVLLEFSDYNNFRNGIVRNGGDYDVYLFDSEDNLFLNVTYNKSIEYVDTSSVLMRKWYFQAYVNDSDGDPFEDANVSAWDVYGTFVLNATTGADGFIPTATLSEYMNNGSRYYYNNYTLSAYKEGIGVTVVLPGGPYFAQNKSINMSNNRLETFTLQSASL